MVAVTDPRQKRFELGAALSVVALVVAVGAFVLWGHQTQQAHEQTTVSGYVAAPDHAGAVALGAVAGVVFLSGVIVMATVPPAPAKKKAKK